MSNNIEIEINKIIESEIVKLKKSISGAAKFNISCNIIRLIGINNTQHYRILQYRISKKIIIYNIQAIEENSFGYDYIDRSNLCDCVKKFSEEEKNIIYIFYRRMLEKNGFTEEIDWINDLILSNKLSIYKKNKKYLSFILSLSAKNTKCILITILIVFIITTISLYDSPIKLFELFYFEKVNYVNINFINHIINTLSIIFNADSRQKFYPISFFGVISLLVYKFFTFIFIANYIIEEIKKRMKV